MIRIAHDESRLNRFITLSGILVSLFIIVFGLMGRPQYLILGFILMAVFLGWLFFGKRIVSDNGTNGSKKICMATCICFVVLFLISVILLRFRPNEYQMPLEFFIIFAGMAGMVFLGILTCTKRLRYIVLIEIMMLGANFVLSQATLFPSVLGIDPWWHQSFTNAIISSGQIPGGTFYSQIPLFHVLIAQLALTTHLDYRSAAMACSAMFILITSLIIYAMGNGLLGSWRIGLVGALMAVGAESVIWASYWLIPTSLAGILLIIIIYLATKTELRKSASGVFVLLLLMFGIVLMHSVTAVCLAFILIAMYIADSVIRHNSNKGERMPLSIPLLFLSIMFSWWMYSSTVFMVSFAEFIDKGFSFDASISGNPTVSTIPVAESIMNNLGSFIFFGLGVLGILYFMSNRSTNRTKLFAFVAVIPAVLAFGTSAIGGYYFQDRFWFFADLTMALPVGFALYSLAGNAIRRINLRHILATSLVMGMAFLMIIGPIANMNNSGFSPNSNVRYALTSSELSAMEFSLQAYPGVKASDQLYLKAATGYLNDNSVNIDKGILEQNFTYYASDLVLIRNVLHTNSFMFEGAKKSALSYDPGVVLEQQGFNLVADNGAVKCYRK